MHSINDLISTENIAYKAKLHELYDTVYNETSLHVHVSTRMLEFSHIVKDKNDDISGFKNEPDFHETLRPLEAGIDCMIQAIKSLAIIFELNERKKVQYFHDKLGKVLHETSEPTKR